MPPIDSDTTVFLQRAAVFPPPAPPPTTSAKIRLERPPSPPRAMRPRSAPPIPVHAPRPAPSAKAAKAAPAPASSSRAHTPDDTQPSRRRRMRSFEVAVLACMLVAFGGCVGVVGERVLERHAREWSVGEASAPRAPHAWKSDREARRR
jgi:hypothetical protein